ncbi:hypothetical protein AA81_09795, partial [Petrotoga halophila DSM 16923]
MTKGIKKDITPHRTKNKKIKRERSDIMSNKIIAQILGIDKGFKLKERKDLRKDGEIYFEVEYSKKVG